MHPLLTVALYTLAIYVFLVVGLRLLGKRQMSQLTTLDLVVIIILGSAVETAMINGNTSLAAGLVSASTLMVANRLLTLLFLRSKWLRHQIGGGPILLIHNGHVVEEHLGRAGLTEADLLESIRERGFDKVDEVQFAVLESDGEINVVPMAATADRGSSDPGEIPGSPKPAPPPSQSEPSNG